MEGIRSTKLTSQQSVHTVADMDLDRESTPRAMNLRAADGHGGVTVVERVLDVLEAFSPSKPEYGLTELAQHLRIPKSTTHRLLMTLERRRYIAVADGRYRLGTRVLDVAHAVVASLDTRRLAHDHLVALRDETGETAHLAVRDETEVVYLDKIDSTHSVRPHTWVGYRAQLHSTSLGKALLAFEDEGVVRRLFLGRQLPRRTARTLVELEQVLNELRRTQDRGYALDDEEDTQGMRCVAAPIRDHLGSVCAAVGIAGPTDRLRDDRIEDIVSAVVSTARVISTQLGAPIHFFRTGGR